MTLVAAIVQEGRTDIPTVNAMWCPRSTVIGLVVDDNSCARWCQGCAVVVELSVEKTVAGELWVDA